MNRHPRPPAVQNAWNFTETNEGIPANVVNLITQKTGSLKPRRADSPLPEERMNPRRVNPHGMLG